MEGHGQSLPHQAAKQNLSTPPPWRKASGEEGRTRSAITTRHTCCLSLSHMHIWIYIHTHTLKLDVYINSFIYLRASASIFALKPMANILCWYKFGYLSAYGILAYLLKKRENLTGPMRVLNVDTQMKAINSWCKAGIYHAKKPQKLSVFSQNFISVTDDRPLK